MTKLSAPQMSKAANSVHKVSSTFVAEIGYMAPEMAFKHLLEGVFQAVDDAGLTVMPRVRPIGISDIDVVKLQLSPSPWPESAGE